MFEHVIALGLVAVTVLETLVYPALWSSRRVRDWSRRRR
jgi:hypothetical protein